MLPDTDSPPCGKADQPRAPTSIQKLSFRLLLLVAVLFGVFTVHRTACLSRKFGDLDVYLRAGWAVRAGICPYDVVCDNAWHYNYPPPYAILMAPLADPPARDVVGLMGGLIDAGSNPTGTGTFAAATALGVCPNPLPPDVGWCVPFVVSAAICYLLNVLALSLGVHLLASALERARGPRGPLDLAGTDQSKLAGADQSKLAGADQSKLAGADQSKLAGADQSKLAGADQSKNERWWALRLVPIWICIVPLGQTLVRGQVNTLVILCICGMLAELIDKRSFRAGLYLAGAISLKIIPGYLLLLPLWLRDRRCLAGTAVGLVCWLGLFPLATIGPARTYDCYARLFQGTVGPALRLGGDSTRIEELIKTTATDNQSFGAVLHNCLHPDPFTRPPEAEPWTRQVHWGLSALLALATLLASGRGELSPARLALLGGALLTLMFLSSPVCHLHYLVMSLPLWMGLLAVTWDRQGWRGPVVSMVAGVAQILFMLGPIVPTLPGVWWARDFGVVTALALLAWGWAFFALLLGRSAAHPGALPVPDVARAT
jgi:hypothetical protein